MLFSVIFVFLFKLLTDRNLSLVTLCGTYDPMNDSYGASERELTSRCNTHVCHKESFMCDLECCWDLSMGFYMYNRDNFMGVVTNPIPSSQPERPLSVLRL